MAGGRAWRVNGDGAEKRLHKKWVVGFGVVAADGGYIKLGWSKKGARKRNVEKSVKID